MCRPIESCDSLGAMGPAAVALFAGYQSPAGNNEALVNQNVKATTEHGSVWSATAATAEDQGFGADGMNMLNMAAPPLALPFVSFPKKNSLPAMPWSTAAPTADLLSMGFLSNQFAATPTPSEIKREMTHVNYEAQELDELLDTSVPDDMESSRKGKPGLLNLDEGFDGTEMSILYSFLVDTPEDESKKVVEVDDGILNLNMLMDSPVEGPLESLETDFTGSRLMMTPRYLEPHMASPKMFKCIDEIKSRRLCKSKGCYKRSRLNGLCISHGGGRRCAVDGCGKSSQGGNLCIRHGGGKRCSHEGCDKAAQSNFLCKAHGGGPRCQFNGCSRSSQGGGFCRSHGGGKRCMFDGCDKGTQRGEYCALHGGSRVCEVPGCMRNDRGGGLCATHGGGKRCTMEACNKPCRRKGLCSAHLRRMEGVDE